MSDRDRQNNNRDNNGRGRRSGQGNDRRQDDAVYGSWDGAGRTNNLLPLNIEAEAGVLGSILIDNDCLADVMEILPDPTYFTHHAFRILYQAILDLDEQSSAIDLLTIVDELQRTGHYGEGDDQIQAHEVSLLANQVPTSANAVDYALVVRRIYAQRGVVGLSERLAQLGFQRLSEDEIYERVEQEVYAFTTKAARPKDLRSLTDTATAYYERLVNVRAARQIVGVPTGLSALDQLTGGLQRSDLLLLAARPSVGKTAMALTIADNAAQQGRTVALFSLEMSEEQVIDRLVAMHATIDLHRLRQGDINDAEQDRAAAAVGILSTMPILIDDTPGITLQAIRSKLRRRLAHGPVDLVIVDYLQLMQPPVGRRGESNRQQDVSDISRGLKLLAREFDVPVLALSQMSRAIEGRADKKPMLSDLRESGSLEQDADVVMFLDREDARDPETDQKGIGELTIAKHRNGPTGKFNLYFKAAQARYCNLSRDEITQDWSPDAPDEWGYDEESGTLHHMGGDGSVGSDGSETEGEA